MGTILSPAFILFDTQKILFHRTVLLIQIKSNSTSLYIQKIINTPCNKAFNTPYKHLNHPSKPKQIQGEFDKSKALFISII